LNTVGDKIGPQIMGQTFFWTANINNWISSSDTTRFWEIIDTQYSNNAVKGDCGALSHLMKKIILLLGDESTKVCYVYPRHSTWNGIVNGPSELHPDPNRLQPPDNKERTFLIYVGNCYEGCCYFQNKFWMGGIGISKNSPHEVLLYVTAPNTDKNDPNNARNQRQCWSDNDTIHVDYPAGAPTAQQQLIP
jgi:hypothetical protein